MGKGARATICEKYIPLGTFLVEIVSSVVSALAAVVLAVAVVPALAAVEPPVVPVVSVAVVANYHVDVYPVV